MSGGVYLLRLTRLIAAFASFPVSELAAAQWKRSEALLQRQGCEACHTSTQEETAEPPRSFEQSSRPFAKRKSAQSGSEDGSSAVIRNKALHPHGP